jgi:S-adenosylmethionine:tRNA ribosyltransferase-isomerase
MLKLSDFDYKLPVELIAQHPLAKRDAARLLVLERKTGKIGHRIFKDIGDYFQKDDLLVLNDTRVLSSRLIGSRITGGKVDILLLERKSGLTFHALIKPARLRMGEKIIFNGGKIFGIIKNRNEVTFQAQNIEQVYGLGVMPLPPYIKRKAEDSDRLNYQTVYAAQDGAVAAPTAGLHFTKELLEDLQSKGISTAYLTLHVGLGTFKPVKSLEVSKHRMEPEYFFIPETTALALKEARLRKSRICAVGTTSCRATEAFATGSKGGNTDLFIYPGYKFQIVNCLLTNFHLARTTLLMLVSAFAGEALIKKAYQEAIDKKYRFYSYGDAMLIL